MTPCTGEALRPFVVAEVGALVSKSMISGFLVGSFGVSWKGVSGKAVICGVKVPRDVLDDTVSRPRIW